MIIRPRIRDVAWLAIVVACLTLPSYASTVNVNGFWDFNNTDGYTLFQETYTDAHNNVTDQGILGLATDATNLYIMFAQQLSVVDNSYGTNAVGWSTRLQPGSGHSFSDLTGSDNATFIVKNGSTTLFNADIDYVTASGSTYKSLGLGGDGHFNSGTAGAGALTGYATSIQWDLTAGNNTCGAPTTNSPDIDGIANTNNPNSTYNNNQTNPNCGTWVFPVIYEISLSLSSLGLAPNANPNTVHSQLDVSAAHNSPAKSADTNVCDDGVVGSAGSTASVALGCSNGGGGQSTPEPSSFALLGFGMLFLGAGAIKLIKRPTDS